MPALTWYLTNAIVGGVHQGLSESSPGADATSSPNYGWTVGTTGSGNYSSADAGSEVATWGTSPAQPDGSIATGASAGDCWRTEKAYSGTFDAGTWLFQMAVIAVTSGGDQDGRAGFRLFRSANADGSGATEITSGILVGGTVTNLTTSTQQTSVHNSTSLGSFTLDGEYLFVQIGWEITGAGAKATRDVIHRVGTTASLVTSPNFTPTPGRVGPVDPGTLASASPGNVAWSSPSNAQVSDDVHAGAAFTGVLDQTSEALRATNFPLSSIPDTAQILEIRAGVERRAAGSGIQDYSVQLVVGGSPSGDDKAAAGDWPTTKAYATYSWTTGLPTTAQVKATDFGFQIRAWDTTGAGNDAFVDHLRVTVFFTDIKSGAAVLSATGTLAAAGSLILSGAAALSASGTLAAAASLILSAQAELTGQATLVATGSRILSAAAVLQGQATLAASGSVIPGAPPPGIRLEQGIGNHRLAQALSHARLGHEVGHARLTQSVGDVRLTQTLKRTSTEVQTVEGGN